MRPNCEEETVITYDRHRSQFVIYFENASQDKSLAYPSGPQPLTSGNLKQTVPYAIEDNQALNLDVFVDKWVIEIFVNGDICIVQRVYPMREDSKQVRQLPTTLRFEPEISSNGRWMLPIPGNRSGSRQQKLKLILLIK